MKLTEMLKKPGATQVATVTSPTPTATPTDATDSLRAAINNATQPAQSSQPTSSPLADVESAFNTVYGNLADDITAQFRAHYARLQDAMNRGGHDISRVNTEIWQFMRDHPETKDLLRPEDIGFFTQVLQKSYGVTLTAKAERKAKTSATAQRKAEAADELADIGF